MALPIYVEPVRLTLETTPAEYRVLEAFIDTAGTNAEIGRRCRIAEETVKTHMRRLMLKAHVDNRTALAIEVLTGRVRVNRRGPEPGDADR